jgi:hypothetical protein
MSLIEYGGKVHDKGPHSEVHRINKATHYRWEGQLASAEDVPAPPMLDAVII